MKEYITKDRARQFVCGHCNEVCSEEPCEPSDCDWMTFIDKEPAADVAEVRHGHWNTINQITTGLPWKYRCSDCGCPQEYTHNYFPNCGARMAE